MSGSSIYQDTVPTVTKPMLATGAITFPFGASTDAKPVVMLDIGATAGAIAYSVKTAATAAGAGNTAVCGVAQKTVAAGERPVIVIKGYVEKVACLTAVAAGDLLCVDTTASTFETIDAANAGIRCIAGRALTAAATNGSLKSCSVYLFDLQVLDV